MNRNFNQKVLDLKGNAVPNNGSVEGLMRVLSTLPVDVLAQVNAVLKKADMGEMTFADVAAESLTQPLDGDDKLSMGAKLKNMKLAMKVMEGECEISTEERDLIKDRVNRRYPGAIVPARTHEFLEDESK